VGARRRQGRGVQRRLLRGARLELGVEPPRVFELGDWADQGERFVEAVGARA
jgi:hypothetical protein